MEFLNIIRNINPIKNPCIIEAQTLLFACRIINEGKVAILSKKNHVNVAALPAIRTKEFIGIIHHVIPEFVRTNSVLDTSFNNIEMCIRDSAISGCGLVTRNEAEAVIQINEKLERSLYTINCELNPKDRTLSAVQEVCLLYTSRCV